MAQGRKKTSDLEKKLRGTDQPCRMEASVPAVAPAMDVLPKVKLKGTAKKIYTVVGTELMSKGLLDMVSMDLVVSYCREMALYQDMMHALDKEGYTVFVETKNGTVEQVNPKRKIAESALDKAKSIAAEFGISPASRARVAAMIAGVQRKDDFAEFEDIDEQ